MKHTIKSNFFTGMIVLLPISLFILVLLWLYGIINSLLSPFTGFYGTSQFISTMIVLFVLFIIIVLVGISVTTKPGQWFFLSVEKNVFDYLPGYKTIKQVLSPFIGKGFTDSFQSVALVDIWDNGTLMTAFVTDTSNKFITVFVPTGPNPTSGNIYHVPKKRVHFIDAKIDQVLQSVIAVGAGSNKLIEKLGKKKK